MKGYVEEYYNIWKLTDNGGRSVSEEMCSKDIEKNLGAYMLWMRIRRNFAGNVDMHDVFSVCDKYFNESGKNADPVALSELLNEKHLLARGTRRAYVASTKLLWLFNHETIIMDRNNLKVLRSKGYRIPDNDYKAYVDAWKNEYAKTRDEIVAAVESSGIADDVCKEEWFCMRVFDRFLWNQLSKTK